MTDPQADKSGQADESWVRIDLCIRGRSLDKTGLNELLHLEGEQPDAPVWAAKLSIESEFTLDDQLRRVEGILAARVDALRSLRGVEKSLNIGWTPRTSQDGVLISGRLISILNEIDCFVLLDTYTDDTPEDSRLELP